MIIAFSNMSWKRFDEFKLLEATDKVAKKGTKRKSVDMNDKKVVQKRRRSLFSFSSSEFSKNREAVPDVNIVDFSSSEEEETVSALNKSSKMKDLPELKYFEKNIIKQESDTTRQANTFTSKSESLTRSKSAPVFLGNSDRNNDLIQWEDSDNASEEDERPSKSFQKSTCQFSKYLPQIEKFDSPVKANNNLKPDCIYNSQEVINESSPSQNIEKQVKVNEEDEYLTKLVDSSKKRRKEVKGGLAERLRKIISRESSDLAFWNHIGAAEAKAGTANRGLILKLINEINCFSVHLLKCQTTGDAPEEIYLMMPKSNWRIMQDTAKSIFLRIYPPWRILRTTITQIPVLLCVQYYETSTTYFTDGGSTDDFCYNGIGLKTAPQSNHGVQKIAGINNEIDHRNSKTRSTDTILYSKEFDECHVWRKCCFSATIEQVFISSENPLPGFSSTTTNNLAKFIQKAEEKNSKATHKITLLAKDTVNRYALINVTKELLLRAVKTENLSNLEGIAFNYENFIITGQKTIFTDPELFLFIESQSCVFDNAKKMENKLEAAVGQKIYVFSGSDESDIKLQKNPARQILNHKVAKSSICFKRFSGFAYFVGTAFKSNGESNYNESEPYSLFIAVRNEVNENTRQETDKCKISVLEILPSCHVPDFIKNDFLEDRIFYFKNLLMRGGSLEILAMDHFSRIFMVYADRTEVPAVLFEDPINACSLMSINEEEKQKLYKRHTTFNKLSCDSETVAVVEGTIVDIDYDNALCWTICSSCKRETEEAIKPSEFFCNFCNKTVQRKMCVQLEAFLENQNLKNYRIGVKLLEETVFSYLSMPITDDFQGFDVSCILGKKFGPSLCYVTEKNDNLPENKIVILSKELQLSKHFEKFIK